MFPNHTKKGKYVRFPRKNVLIFWPFVNVHFGKWDGYPSEKLINSQ